ncbi:hypothetical protein LY90DRAFT_517382 [Neocallimastix californiae]|uniref:Uncharacterized protein n=1 Tax=Neocallimastix californiae TaxID=1754190 RepID=A0A1Y2A846_9FUNG|nr:hypothetical protein LY90DRAFT_517382 [Neocallimastix californiae]|eukprot:ORY18654.1 hypothetical protein LY90DRAFT_517382 [Neocallimastix californiae]
MDVMYMTEKTVLDLESSKLHFFVKLMVSKCNEINEISYYLYKSNNAYICVKSGVIISCESSTIETAINHSGKNGEVNKDSKLTLCLISDQSIELNNANSGNSVTEYAVVSINGKSVMFNTSYNNNLKYLCVDKTCDKDSTKYRVMDKGYTCSKESGINNIMIDNISPLFFLFLKLLYFFYGIIKIIQIML